MLTLKSLGWVSDIRKMVAQEVTCSYPSSPTITWHLSVGGQKCFCGSSGSQVGNDEILCSATAILKMQVHTQVANSLTTVSTVDPETAPCPSKLSYSAIFHQCCHQPHMPRGLGEVTSIDALANRSIDLGLSCVP